jgi:hypothetical protein
MLKDEALLKCSPEMGQLGPLNPTPRGVTLLKAPTKKRKNNFFHFSIILGGNKRKK